MARLLPFQTEVTLGDRDPKVVDLDGDEADEVFAALSSTTSRRTLALLYEDPRTASDLAEELDTTLQNVQYHVGKLSDADLIEVVDTWYSETGTEMKVYAPTDSALVLFAGDGSSSTLRAALSRLLGAVGVLGIASLVVDRLARRLVTPPGAPMAADEDEPVGIATDGGDDAEAADAVEEEDSADAVEEDAAEADEEESAGDADSDETVEEDAADDPEEAEDAAAPEENATPDDAPTEAPTDVPTETPAPTETPTPESIAGDPALAELYATLLEPGMLFFLGGLVALALVAGWWYATSVR